MPAINPLPTPPSRNDPANFSDRADAFLAALPAYTSEANALLDDVHTSRDTVQGLRDEVMAAGLASAATNAATATTKAADASASAAEAFGYLQTYRATSYGALANDPVVDPNGNPPTVGDEYFNTTMNLLKRFNGVTWQASDIATANLAAPSGSALVGYDSGAAQDVLDNAKAMANYTALRNYTGRATGVRITQAGLAGSFQRDDADTISADNGGTIIVDGAGRRWKRLHSEPLNIRWFGGVADYTGTPLYDGADAGRVTATDNTTAFQNLVSAAIAAGHDSVRIPAGHWGIKTGNLSFASFNKLRIFGGGIGVTILDFFKEDATGTSYVDNAQAQAIASFTTGNAIEFADMTIKATTKGGVVNGTTGPANAAAVYYGKIWGFKINNVKDVRLTRVRADRFNYRGFSVYGSATERVTLTHCEGFYNTSTGYWIEDADVLKVNGGEFAYNGIFGNPGTGYGVTGSANIGRMIAKRPYCHHNYRKGIDSHGCAEFIVNGGTFRDNVLYHIANPNWTVPAGVADCVAIIKDNTFSNGWLPDDKAWLKSCYDALVSNGFTGSAYAGRVIEITDIGSTGTVLDKYKSITISGNTVLSHYNGIGDTGLVGCEPWLNVIARTADVTIKGNKFDFKHAAMPNGGNVYSHLAMQFSTSAIEFCENSVKFIADTKYTNSTSGSPDRGMLMCLSNVGVKLRLFNNNFVLNDVYFSGATGSGIRIPAEWGSAYGAKRTAIGNTWDYMDDPWSNSVQRLNDQYFLGNNSPSFSPLQQSDNAFISNGIMRALPSGPLDLTSNAIPYSLTGVSKTTGQDVFYIVLDKQYQTSIRITTKDGSPDLVVNVPFSSYSGISGTTGNALFEFSGADASFVEDGRTKLKVTIKAKANLSGEYFGNIIVNGALPSFGAEKVVKL